MCHLTGVRLDETGASSPRFMTFDHVVPGDDSTPVVCARWVDRMKVELTEDGFRAITVEHVRYQREGGELDRRVVDFEYWLSYHRQRTRRPR